MPSICPTRLHMNAVVAFRPIEEPDRHIVVRERALDDILVRSIAQYLRAGPGLILTRGTPDAIYAEIRSLFPLGCIPLLADAIQLARQYRQLAGTPDLRLRLERIDDDSCRCFHIDNVPLRLLCTYAGPGVQWKTADDETIHDTSEGSLILLKGRLFPRRSDEGAILHRSPPLSTMAPGTRRLLLTLDHPDACTVVMTRAPMAAV